MVEAVGPIFTGGYEIVKAGEYDLQVLPDLKNDQLQAEGKAPVYYWMPKSVRLARENVGTGPAKFHMTHFVGVQSGDTTVGVTGTREVAGGLISFSTTAAPSEQELEAAHNEILNRFRGSSDRFWGWRTAVAPMFRPMPVMACTTTITNLSPNSRGQVPVTRPNQKALTGAPRDFQFVGSVKPAALPRKVRDGVTPPSSNLDPWFIDLQGQGNGPINLLGESAFSGLMGSFPAALCWSSFHGGEGALTVWQNYKLKFWAPALEISIKGNWDTIFEHFSAAVSAHYLWAKADVQAEVNNMRANGTLDVKITVDPTIPGADKFTADIDKRTDLIVQKFMEQAQKRIFEPPAPKVDPAHADSGNGPWGVGLALKYRRDTNQLNLSYHETREIAYMQDCTVSGTLQGFIDEIKTKPEMEKHYFTTLYLDDWDRKVTRTIKPIVNWPDEARKWVGEPVAFLSAQIGYPDVNGSLQWSAHMFQSSDGDNAIFQPAMAKKNLVDVANPPEGWAPDITFVKRKIHFSEPPDTLTYPHARIQIETEEVDLDPGPNGTPTNEGILEIRADSAGKLDVAPITLGVDLENDKQFVEVSFKCEGKTKDGQDRPIQKFQWNHGDQNEQRIWGVYTGQLDFVPRFKYQVRVVIKGSLFTKGMEWTGPWVESNGNGPLMITVPTPEDEGVTVKRDFPLSAGTVTQPGAPASNGTAPGAPPAMISPSHAGSATPGALGGSAAPGMAAGAPSSPAGAPPTSSKAIKSGRNRGYDLMPSTKAGPSRPGSGDSGADVIVAGWSNNDPDHKTPVVN
jgi:hypothetical protein